MIKQLTTEKLNTEQLTTIYYKMVLIRRFEETLKSLYQQGKIHGTMHLCIGQEATAVGSCFYLTSRDKITSTHRGHGHAIAKGMDTKKMMAELLGKATGYCKGKGGSMHIADLNIGNLGANGIVAAGLPIATGAALAAKMQKDDYIVVSYFGDGASNEGAFHEALNLASVWKLPVIFFCENNLYGMSGSIKEMINIEHIAERASAYGMKGETFDGNDVFTVIKKTKEAVDYVKNGNGPILLEAKTYRWEGHSRSDARKYRTKEEENKWKNELDPINRFEQHVIANQRFTEQQLADMREQVEQEIREALQFAEESPEPSIESLMEDIYAE